MARRCNRVVRLWVNCSVPSEQRTQKLACNCGSSSRHPAGLWPPWITRTRTSQAYLAIEDTILVLSLSHRASGVHADSCVPVSQLSSCRKLNIPWFRRSTFGTIRAFSVAVPTVWNSLPDFLCDLAVESA